MYSLRFTTMALSRLADFPSAVNLALCLIASMLIIAVANRPNLIYRSFERRGTQPFRWSPIHKVVREGYHEIIKKTGRPFVVRWWAKDYIIMPPKYLNDVRGAGWQHLSFFANISSALHLYTSVGDLYTAESSQRMVDIVKRKLNPQIPHLTADLVEEIEFSLDKLLGDCSEWKHTKAMALMAELTHRTATRVLISKKACRDELFIRKSMSLLESIFITALVIAKLPLGPLLGILAWPLGILHRRKLYTAMELLRPIVDERIQENVRTKDSDRHDAIQWTLELFPQPANLEQKDRLLKELLHNLWAGSSAPGGMMTEIIWNLLLHRDYVPELREEIEGAINQYGWTEKMVNSLHLLDSFIRETNRLSSTGSITCVRTVVDKPFQFSDGLILPAGTRFGFPSQAIQDDNQALSNSSQFDGFRHANKNGREQSETDGDRRDSASSVDTHYLPWGYGNHVCPGRFFAVRLMKLVIAKLLLDYDIEWDRKMQDRPRPVHIEGQFVPNMSQKIALKKRIRD
ncbi:unnamed protein product [Periconia digitata]|uniref:Cytochrome P450 n=1 Tax=Periconia digitata TaxID=1303443 RepID=A0A9W4XJV9_9PLEO|nr:unnamed protein product [Periconia digitata]